LRLFVFGGKGKKAKPAEVEEKVEEETRWQMTLRTLREKDPQLYEFAIRLHLDPMRGISEKLRAFLRKEVDVLSLNVEDVVNEAARCAQEGMYARAMNGYVCAIDLLFLQAARRLSEGGNEGTRREYEAKVASCLSRLKELEESGKRGEGDEVPWLGLIKAYANVSGRAGEVLGLAVEAYGERITTHGTPSKT
jgi:hypothetical protein